MVTLTHNNASNIIQTIDGWEKSQIEQLSHAERKAYIAIKGVFDQSKPQDYAVSIDQPTLDSLQAKLSIKPSANQKNSGLIASIFEAATTAIWGDSVEEVVKAQIAPIHAIRDEILRELAAYEERKNRPTYVSSVEAWDGYNYRAHFKNYKKHESVVEAVLQEKEKAGKITPEDVAKVKELKHFNKLDKNDLEVRKKHASDLSFGDARDQLSEEDKKKGLSHCAEVILKEERFQDLIDQEIAKENETREAKMLQQYLPKACDLIIEKHHQ
ncbi:MAG: hypothetical protein JSR37_03955 [Verrucomicrobia bacterium]|nr:hypothetical protein [Verrucomicrobiota bacterium]MBS0637184.1 hypothetical protein [Verrucomicrobiota bacterium]